MTLEPGKY